MKLRRTAVTLTVTVTALLVAACGGSASVSKTAVTTTATTGGTVPPTAAPVPCCSPPRASIADASGSNWSVTAGFPSLVNQYTAGGTIGGTYTAGPGKAYVTVKLKIENPSSRAEALLGLLGARNDGGADVYLGVPAAQQSGTCDTSIGSSLTSPGGLCANLAHVLLADGTDVGEAEGLNETPQVPAGGTVDVTVYSGPFPASFDLHNLRVLIDAGTSLVAVIELP